MVVPTTLTLVIYDQILCSVVKSQSLAYLLLPTSIQRLDLVCSAHLCMFHHYAYTNQFYKSISVNIKGIGVYMCCVCLVYVGMSGILFESN